LHFTAIKQSFVAAVAAAPLLRHIHPT